MAEVAHFQAVWAPQLPTREHHGWIGRRGLRAPKRDLDNLAHRIGEVWVLCR